MGAGGRLAQALCVAQPLSLGGELGFLGRVGPDLVDLGELVAVEVEVALAGAVALAQLLQLGLEPAALAVGLAIALAQRQMGLAGESVEDLHLRRGDRQLAVLVLPVKGDQRLAERLEVGGGGGAPGHEGRGPPRGRDAAAEDDLLRPLREPFGELCQRRLLQQPRR